MSVAAAAAAASVTSPPPPPPPPSAFFFAHLTRGDGAEAAAMLLDDDVDYTTASAADVATMQSVLWRDHTPDTFKAALQQLTAAETVRAGVLRERVQAAWREVEETCAHNATRQALLQHTEALSPLSLEAAVAGEAGDALWSRQRVAQRYALPPLREYDVATSKDDEQDEQACSTDGSSAAPRSAATRATPRTTRSNNKALLDVMRQPHPLRRWFTRLLQQRAELPAQLQPLLDDVQTLQCDTLAHAEATLQQTASSSSAAAAAEHDDENKEGATTSAAVAAPSLPLHVPFRSIAQLLSRVIVPMCVEATADGEAVVRTHTRLRHDTATHASRLRGYVTDAAAAAAAAAQHNDSDGHHHHHQATDDDDDDDGSAAAAWRTTQRNAAEHMWQLLFAELMQCKQAYADGLAAYTRLQHDDDARHAHAHDAVAACDAETRAAMTAMRDVATHNAAVLATARATAQAAASEVTARYRDEEARLRTLLRTHEAALTHSAAAQERHARRVREELKAMTTEQTRYTTATQAALQTRLSLAQLHVSHTQLRGALDAYSASAVDTHAQLCRVQTLLDDADVARQQLLAACHRQLTRVARDARYRRCVLLRQLHDTARQWGRCVRDMSVRYTQRYTALEQKTTATWQAGYLLSSEREWALQNVLDVRRQVDAWQRAWHDVRRLRRAADEDEADAEAAVALAAAATAATAAGADVAAAAAAAANAAANIHEDKDDDNDDAQERHACMRVLDGDWLRQRGTTTLRQYLHTHTSTQHVEHVVAAQQQQQQQQQADGDTADHGGERCEGVAAGSGRVAAQRLTSGVVT